MSECPQLAQSSALSTEGFIVTFWLKACANPRGIRVAGWEVGPGVPPGRGEGKNQTPENQRHRRRQGTEAAGCPPRRIPARPPSSPRPQEMFGKESQEKEN